MSAVRNMIVARAIERNESEKQTLRFSEVFYGIAEATFDFTNALNVASRAVENPPIIRIGKCTDTVGWCDYCRLIHTL